MFPFLVLSWSWFFIKCLWDTERCSGNQAALHSRFEFQTELRDSGVKIPSSVNSIQKYIALVVSNSFWSLGEGCWFIVSDVILHSDTPLRQTRSSRPSLIKQNCTSYCAWERSHFICREMSQIWWRSTQIRPLFQCLGHRIFLSKITISDLKVWPNLLNIIPTSTQKNHSIVGLNLFPHLSQIHWGLRFMCVFWMSAPLMSKTISYWLLALSICILFYLLSSYCLFPWPCFIIAGWKRELLSTARYLHVICIIIKSNCVVL